MLHPLPPTTKLVLTWPGPAPPRAGQGGEEPHHLAIFPFGLAAEGNWLNKIQSLLEIKSSVMFRPDGGVNTMNSKTAFSMGLCLGLCLALVASGVGRPSTSKRKTRRKSKMGDGIGIGNQDCQIKLIAAHYEKILQIQVPFFVRRSLLLLCCS